MMIKCRICDDILEIIESTNDGLFYIEPCPSCVADAVKAVEQLRALDGGEVLPLHSHIFIDGHCACGRSIERHRQ